MSIIKQSHVLSLNCNPDTLTFTNNEFISGSVISFPFESYKISIISTKALKVLIQFHHNDDTTSFKTNTITLVPNEYVYLVNVIEGEKMRITLNLNGQTFTDTDKIVVNTYLSTTINHLITI